MKPVSTIEARLGIQNGGPAHAYFTEQCYKHMMPFVPGGVISHLNNLAKLNVDSITYASPDAHYLYVGKLYVDPVTKSSYARKGVTKIPTNKNLKYHTLGTGAFWDRRMISFDMNEVVKEVQTYVDRGCK